MAIVGALLLVVVLLFRPMEIVPSIAKLHLLEVLTVITAIGLAIEAARRRGRAGFAPQLPWLAGFLGWAFLVTTVKLGSQGLSIAWATIALGAIFMVLIGYAATSVQRLTAMVVVLVASLAVISGIAVHQGMQPRQCLEIIAHDPDDPELAPDGRECERPRACEQGGKEGAEYLCERVGALSTNSAGGRVRFRGQLADPNELSVFVGAGLPLLYLLGIGRSRGTKLLFLAPVAIASLWAVVLTQSRTGQIVLGTITLIALVRRFGLFGSLFSLGVLPLLLLFGGREGAESDASKIERAMILREGLELFRAHPFLGVGLAQFNQEISIPMTAHNSYLLVAAELGLFGLVLWMGMLWMTLKIAIVVVRDPPPGLDPELLRFAEAFAVSFTAILAGVFFLSFCYKQLLFVWIGLGVALYGAVRARAPAFRVRTTGRDVLGIVACAIGALAVTYVFSRASAG